METTPASSTSRPTKVRTTKSAVPKSGDIAKKPTATKVKPKSAQPVSSSVKPKAAATPRKRKSTRIEPAAAPDLTHMIATAAYYLAEQRHFAPGYEMQDWLAAELMIRSSISRK